ncbi:hypothetical protein OK348_02840 [Flavobacterium sp. MXW15]|uniref:DUF2178 domain-containing protein n=1 Tax=Xanthomonas chitinilytica TaxID=2989819 RepID=A0ABT3JS17_9XANT|nr:hypothetical protein [Xanthomonas sp. H13-6]MCW4453732.1 hypothetical protein [Flavobacterium sp. MXW15]MCW4471220.1 hypothetical protein [Xanthomonas sp. H13-6]
MNSSMREGRKMPPERGMAAPFGERFAWSMASGMAGLGLFTLVAVVWQGSLFPLLAVVVVLPLSHGFRRRALFDARRHRGVLEDERDAAILAAGDRAFRLAASTLGMGLALALLVPAVRAWLLAAPATLTGMLLLGLIAANAAAHVAVALRYRRDGR